MKEKQKRNEKSENNQKSNTNLQFGLQHRQRELHKLLIRRELQVDTGNLLEYIAEKWSELKERKKSYTKKQRGKV